MFDSLVGVVSGVWTGAKSASHYTSLIKHNGFLFGSYRTHKMLQIINLTVRNMVSLATLLRESIDQNYNYPSNINIRDYISFTRFINISKYNADKISCDWCSMVNGVVHFIIDRTRCSPIKTASFNLVLDEILTRLFKYVDYYSSLSKLVPNRILIETYARRMVYQSKDNDWTNIQCKLMELKLIVNTIEQTWCPFKHLKEMAFENDYTIYDSNVIGELKEASERLKKHGIIDCKQCPLIISSTYPLMEEDSIMKPFLDLLVDIVYERVM